MVCGCYSIMLIEGVIVWGDILSGWWCWLCGFMMGCSRLLIRLVLIGPYLFCFPIDFHVYRG